MILNRRLRAACLGRGGDRRQPLAQRQPQQPVDQRDRPAEHGIRNRFQRCERGGEQADKLTYPVVFHTCISHISERETIEDATRAGGLWLQH